MSKHKTLPIAVITRRQAAIKTLLRKGKSVGEVAHLVTPKVSPRRVREIADRSGLPLNPRVSFGSKIALEAKRLKPLGFDNSQLGQVFRQTPARIASLLKNGYLE